MPFNYDTTNCNKEALDRVYAKDARLIEHYGTMRFDITGAMLLISQAGVYELTQEDLPAVLAFIDNAEIEHNKDAPTKEDFDDTVSFYDVVREHVRNLVGIKVYTTRH